MKKHNATHFPSFPLWYEAANDAVFEVGRVG